MSEFVTRIKVRHYELDTLGHVNHAVYHQYAEVARFEWFRHMGGDELAEGGLTIAPVLLETRVWFLRELRNGEEIDVTCDATFGDGKTFTMYSEIRKLDGTVSAKIVCVLGVMDLNRRKLVDKPVEALRELGLRV